MLTPPTTIPGAGSSIHDFGVATLIVVGLFVVMGWWIGGGSRRRSRRRRRRVKTIAPLHAWKVDGKVDYKAYVASPQWRHRRNRITRRQHGCQWNMNYTAWPTGISWLGYRRGCRAKGPFHGHHMSYLHLGRERKGEVVKLCHDHHALVPTRPHPPLEQQQVFFGFKRRTPTPARLPAPPRAA